jgi:biopolymer transport protein ExbD
MGIRIKMSETIYIQEDNKKRKATAEEIAQFKKDQEEFSLLEAEQQAKAEAKASAMAKLAALGLNEEEVQAIIGA